MDISAKMRGDAERFAMLTGQNPASILAWPVSHAAHHELNVSKVDLDAYKSAWVERIAHIPPYSIFLARADLARAGDAWEDGKSLRHHGFFTRKGM